MAVIKQQIAFHKTSRAGKKTRQGLGRGTKFNNRLGSKRFKKKYVGQGKFR